MSFPSIDQIEAENAAMSQNPAAALTSAPHKISGQGSRDLPLHMTAGLFSVAEPIDAILEIDPSTFMNMAQVSPSLELTDPEFQPYIAQAWASFQADRTLKDASSAPSKGKRVRFDSVVIPPRTSRSMDPCTASVSEEQEILSPEVQQSSQAAATRSTCPATLPVDSRIHNPKATDSSGSNQPSSSMPSSTSSNANSSSSFVPSSQYRYSFPLEDETASKRMLDNVLAASVKVPVKDLFAVAPDFRKQFREITVTKHIAALTNVVQVNELSGRDPELIECEYGDRILRNDEGLIVVHYNLPLHCIEARISGTEQSLTCVLDSGSKVVAMSKHIWQQLGLPIRSDHKMTTSSANMITDSTLGVLENLTLDFSLGEICLQVQIIARANFDLLLGCPLHCLMSATTNDFPDGDQTLTLHDPNTRKEYKLPTCPWWEGCLQCCQRMKCQNHQSIVEMGF